ncbi:MAG: TRAP transporter substrate-binding protein [Burkholderiales bacterium]|nr:TRAP transporter substrate-binding protein [Burkholderiales bacterium]
MALGRIGSAAFLSTCAALALSLPSFAATTLKFHHDLPEDSAQHVAAVKFAQAVESRTGGEIVVKIFPNNSLGDDVEATQQMQLGAIQGGIVPTAKLSNFDPSMQLVDLPFLFPSAKAAYTFLDGPVGERLLAQLDKIGLKGVTFWESGFKQFTCNSPVNGPGDFKGKKVRVMESPLIMAQFKALNANPLPIAFSETYSALQQGVADCQENPLVSIVKMKFYEVQSDVVISNHAYLGYAFVFSKRWFDKLKPEQRDILVKAAREMTAFEREETARREASYVADIRKSKARVTTLTPEQAKAFRDATRPVYAEFEKPIGKDLMQSALKAIDAAPAR